MPLVSTFGAAASRGFGLFSAPAAVLDQYFEYVTLLLPGNGTNGAQNNTFLDSSTNNFTITRNGNTTQGTFSPYGDNWSNYFDGAGDYLTTAASNVNNFGTGDWTFEFWINSTQTTRVDPIGWNYSFSSAGWAGVILNVAASGQMSWYEQSNQRINATSTGWNNGAWNHIAVSRSGNSIRMFLNGTQVGSTYTTSFSYGANSTGFIVGVNNDGTGPLNGYISNVRIIKGTAQYTANFTPPTAPLTAITNTSLLTCQSNRFIDNSTNAFTITVNGNTSVQRFSPFSPTASYASGTIGGSGYFDGTGDSLSVADNTALQMGSGDFTIEFWINFNSISSYQTPLSKGYTGTNALLIQTGNGNGRLVIYANGGAVITETGTAVTGEWIHYALVRNGSTLTLYRNGTSSGSATVTTNFNNTSTLYIGSSVTTSPEYPINGYMSNVRFVKGTAVYTTTFTPPTAPLTAITNTSLLCNFTNAGIIDNAMMNDLETGGNAQISTTQSKFGGSSMYFDGTGDYLTRPGSNLFDFGTGDFTIEAWIYPAATQTQYANIICEGSTGNNWYLSFGASNVVTFSTYATTLLTSSSGLSNSTWTHVAVSRSGTSLKMFFNGTQVASATDSTSLGATAALFVGFNNSAHYFNGYIDDLRVTKGVARYTTNFTPPTAAFPTR